MGEEEAEFEVPVVLAGCFSTSSLVSVMLPSFRKTVHGAYLLAATSVHR